MASLRTWGPLAALLALTAALLFPSSQAQYVWDDASLILRNPNLAEPTLAWLLGGDLWAGVSDSTAHFFRPLMLASLWVDQALGLGPFGAQLHSLGWHLLSVGLLVALLRRHLSPQAALLGGTLLALHPMQSSVVRFVAARNDPMALSFVLLAALALSQKSWRFQVLAGLATLAALLSKETALAALGAVALLPWVRGQDSSMRKLVGPLFGGLAWALMRAFADVDSPAPTVDPMLPLWAGSEALQCALWTPGCSPMMAPSELSGMARPGLILLALLALGAWKGGRLGRFGALWFAWTAAAGLVGALLADGLGWRYLDIPLAGLAIVLASLGWPSDRRTLLASAGLALLLAVPLRMVLPMWASDQSLWEQAYEVQPGPPTACGLFKAYELSGQDEAASTMLPKALPRPHCCYNASRFYLDRGQPELALSMGGQALQASCEPSPELTAPMALSAALLGDWGSADELIAMNPADPYGYTPLVASAVAWRAGDPSVLEAYAAEPAPEGAPPLEEQVDWLLKQSGPGLHETSTPAP